MKTIIQLSLASVIFSWQLHAQVAVDVNLNVKHEVNGVSNFNREAFIVMHSNIHDKEWPNSNMEKDFYNDYDVYYGRNNGSLPFYIRSVNEDPNKTGWPNINDIKAAGTRVKNNYKNKNTDPSLEARNNSRMMGGQFNNYPTGNPLNACCGKTNWTVGSNEAAAEFYANFLKEAHGTGGATGEIKPKYLEVINEPFVKAGTYGTTRQDISEFHVAVAKRVKELNPNVQVGGYTAAYPQYEANNFGHWNNNWKRFIDVAGADMDFFSLHIYDGRTRGASEDYYRAGSNMEAMLDMIEAYSKIKLGEVKPFNISEYGYFWQDDDPEEYTKEFDWHNIRSFSTIMMQLMEKPDLVVKSIPFMILQANWWSHATNPNAKYPYRLLRQKKELAGETGDEFVFTELIKFFQLWSDVKGTRIDTKASDIDIQVDAYVDGKKMYLILNNMEFTPQTLDLNFIDTESNPVTSITAKHLYEVNRIPTYDINNLDIDTKQIQLAKEATMILEYTFQNDVLINETSSETKVYADTYLQPIVANNTKTFKFATSELTKASYGELVLRLGIGRSHSNSGFVYPEITFNGTPVSVPTDWRGYDQSTRPQFFGVLEIPIPYELIDTSIPNNEIRVKFASSGGHISSAVLQKFDFSTDIRTLSSEHFSNHTFANTLKVYENPASEFIKISGNIPNNSVATIYDITGKEVLKINDVKENKEIIISNLSNGTYFIEVNNKLINTVLKFIKE